MFKTIKPEKNIPDHIVDDLRYLDKNDPESIFLLNFQNNTEHNIPSGQSFGKKEIIYSGCSQTHGYYLDDNQDLVWGNILSSRLNKNSINLAVRGDSISNIISRIYSYIDNFGQPEYIFCLFPDPFRLMSPRDERYLVNEKDLRMHGILELSQYFANNMEHQWYLNKQGLLPNIKQQVIPNTLTLFLSIQSILHLEVFCKSANIVLKYGTWSTILEKIIESVKSENVDSYKNFVNLKTEFWDDYSDKTLFKDCHKDSPYCNDKLFSSGSDQAHIGIHRNIHISDDFFESL